MRRNSKEPAEPDVTGRLSRKTQGDSAETTREQELDSQELKSQVVIKAARDFARSIAGENKVKFIHTFQIALELAKHVVNSKPAEFDTFSKMMERGVNLVPAQFYSDPTFIENAVKLIENENFILGGTPTTGFPECVAVGSPSRGWDCTGTLIAPNAVLTARHCDVGVRQRILVGADVDDATHTKLYDVIESVPHPVHNKPNENDLAILILKESIKGVAPAQPASDDIIKAAHSVIVVGFGSTDPDGRMGRGKKRMVEVPICSYSCAAIDRKFGCFEGLELVAIGVDRDSCEGDSGGPAYVEYKGRYYLAGVTSRGVGSRCGDGGIYVRVDKYAKWIYEEVLPLYPPK